MARAGPCQRLDGVRSPPRTMTTTTMPENPGDENAKLDSFHFTYPRGEASAARPRAGSETPSASDRAASKRGNFLSNRGCGSRNLLAGASLIGVTTALASSENLRTKALETKPVSVLWGQPSCILFRQQFRHARVLADQRLEGLSSDGYQGPVRAPGGGGRCPLPGERLRVSPFGEKSMIGKIALLDFIRRRFSKAELEIDHRAP